jgi:mono/diheme cytochrome c family protein
MFNLTGYGCLWSFHRSTLNTIFMRKFIPLAIILCAVVLFAIACQQSADTSTAAASADSIKFNGYASQVKWGEHLVTVGGCHDCHTPKKFGPGGMEPDMTLALSGHPTAAPIPDVDRMEMAKKGLSVTNDLTVWVGPWGVSFASNLTPDSTGIGAWKEEQFIYAIRNGVYKGLPGSRPLLPPMPWQTVRMMTDDELKAMFAYLQTIPAIKNIVPSAELNAPPAK